MPAAMRATLAGSSGSSRMSCFAGLPLGTAQKPHPRVHQAPKIMNVAAPRWKHSWMLGQRADSQTVLRFNARNLLLRRLRDSKCVRLLRAHSGSRGRAAPICIRGPVTLPANRAADLEAGFQLGLGVAQGDSIRERRSEE